MEATSSNSTDIQTIANNCEPLGLPKAYLEFLEKYGKGGGVFIGEDYTNLKLRGLKEALEKLLEVEHFPKTLQPEDFVFLSVQGCQYYFFKLNNESNPPVYGYFEGITRGNFDLVAESFSAFLVKHAQGLI